MDLTEDSLLELLEAIRAPLRAAPDHVIVTQAGLDQMKALCAECPEFRNRVLSEFPQLEGLV